MVISLSTLPTIVELIVPATCPAFSAWSVAAPAAWSVSPVAGVPLTYACVSRDIVTAIRIRPNWRKAVVVVAVSLL